ncbi:AMP-binding protein [Rhizobiales bacterium]|uniref:AMP-binding protein n=1 Tax=Hongsoonwoonella zoysiae TaxID=2821844 RepID=UPI00156106BD|nr:AMP-binding protein [Hongsoonwoonella zoysiae]NRG19545.1 AMP-binding protein [Hongsoonwoonella zoysiae]
MNLAAWLLRAGRAQPGSPAVAVGTRSVATYSDFARRAARLAEGLCALPEVKAGDRVAIFSKNCIEYLEILYGIWWAGLAAVPINAKLHAAEAAWILEHSGASVAFVGADAEAEIGARAPESLRHLVTIRSPAYDRLFSGDAAPLADTAPDDLAWLFYTSGTTGRPKGAMLSHRNLLSASYGYLTDVDPTNPGDTLLHAAPMSHGSGIYIMAHVGRFGINAVAESGGFDPVEVLSAFAEKPGISMFAAPTMIKRLVECPLEPANENIRTIIWGGAPMHIADIRRAVDRFGPHFAQIYGQGETPMTATVLSKADIADRDHPRWLERLGSAGIVNSAVEIRIGGENDETLPAGETGEILVRGDAVMLGYWNNTEATKETLRGGWLHTGDVGAIDEEGYVTLKDRSKDVIISGGSNIYPREVEEVLLSHPGVREASVIGRTDPEWGEVVIAYYSGEAGPGELDELCLNRIARFKRPKDYIRLESLPKNNYGKILKTDLREADEKRAGKFEEGH